MQEDVTLLWQKDRELFWKYFSAEMARGPIGEMIWQSERKKIAREIRLAPSGHWARGGALSKGLLLEGLESGKRDLPTSFEEVFPGQIEEYWQRALPELRPGPRSRQLVSLWARQAQSFRREEDWQDAFSWFYR